MKGKHEIESGSPSKKGISAINKRDVVVFAFFLLLSFIFWYLNSLEKVTESDIRFQLKYINTAKEGLISDESSDRLSVYLKGSGYSILKLRLSGSKSPVIIDISKVSYKKVPGKSKTGYFIVTSELEKSLSVQLRSECEITSIKPDTLFFNLNKAETN